MVLFGVVAPALGFAGRDSLQQRVKSLERMAKGRLGIAILDVDSGKRFNYRADQRFPMCSTFKLLLVGAVLSKVDQKREKLDRMVKYTKADLVANSPITENHVAEGQLPIVELCMAAMTESDNTATNLLLRSNGGTERVNRLFTLNRRQGDEAGSD